MREGCDQSGIIRRSVVCQALPSRSQGLAEEAEVTPQEHTQRIIDDICARTGITRDRLLRRPDPAEHGSDEYKNHVRYYRAELAWRLRNEKTPPTPHERIVEIMNARPRSIGLLIAIWADLKRWQDANDRMAA